MSDVEQRRILYALLDGRNFLSREIETIVATRPRSMRDLRGCMLDGVGRNLTRWYGADVLNAVHPRE